MKQKLFGNLVPVSCEHCFFSAPQADGTLLCTKKRRINEDGSCRRYKYNPLKRTPRNLPKLPEYDPENFSL